MCTAHALSTRYAYACTAQCTAHALRVPGTLLLTYDGGPPNPGDVFSLGAAAASALYIVRLSSLSSGLDATRLSAATLALSGAACTGISIAQAAAAGELGGLAHQAVTLLRHGWAQLLYLSVAVTATANLLQAYGQQRVGAAEAAVIYTMDPVYNTPYHSTPPYHAAPPTMLRPLP